MFEVAKYVPILHFRVAEQKAYRELPSPTKDLIIPVFVIRPWPNASKMQTVWDKIQEAVAGRPFAVDLDSSRKARASDKPAQVDFDRLFDSSNVFDAYYSAIAEVDGAIPVLRSADGEFIDAYQQFVKMQLIGRGGFVRFQREGGIALDPVLQLLNDPVAEGVAVILDLGWDRHVLLQEAWATAMVTAITDVDPEREIVICGSSFPDSFKGVGALAEFQIEERSVYAAVRRKMNARLMYGDWGSTRKPQIDAGVMVNIPRIDLAKDQSWKVYRSEKYDPDDSDSERETYKEIAERVVVDSDWSQVPDLWGRFIIECTAQGLPGAIRAAGTAAAVRINVHLHMQAHYETPQLIGNTEEPYVD